MVGNWPVASCYFTLCSNVYVGRHLVYYSYSMYAQLFGSEEMCQQPLLVHILFYVTYYGMSYKAF